MVEFDGIKFKFEFQFSGQPNILKMKVKYNSINYRKLNVPT